MFSTRSPSACSEPFSVESRNFCSSLGNPSENTLTSNLQGDLVGSCVMHLDVNRCHPFESCPLCILQAGRAGGIKSTAHSNVGRGLGEGREASQLSNLRTPPPDGETAVKGGGGGFRAGGPPHPCAIVPTVPWELLRTMGIPGEVELREHGFHLSFLQMTRIHSVLPGCEE